MNKLQKGFTLWELTVVVLIVTVIPAWITHVVSCISSQEWFFLLAGAICAPVGVIHGWGIWLGVW